MICPRCKSEQYGNFCGNCGTKMRERCSCGKMEPIGRKVCFTKLWEAKKKVDDFAKNRLSHSWLRYLWFVEILIAFAPVGVLFYLAIARDLFESIKSLAAVLETTLGKEYGRIVSLLLMVSIFIILLFWQRLVQRWSMAFQTKVEKNIKKRASEEFSINFPVEAELLKRGSS